mmetsp:Transcript_9247/g.812  ORF Transcript_9247/g.812 Transcript_9247/m.812 type:complete len:103 (+) Transcript_9247:49-357(+)
MIEAYKNSYYIRLDGRRLIVDVERGRTMLNFIPRKFGGGLGKTRYNAEDSLSRSRSRDRKRKKKDKKKRRSVSSSLSQSKSRSRSRSERKKRKDKKRKSSKS